MAENIITTNVSFPRLLKIIKERGGFIRDNELESIVKHDRLRPVLVRCNNCRFTCGAQDVKHLIEMIEKSGDDYIRDVSLPTSDDIWKD